ELQGAPEPAVDLHQDRLARALITLVFDHCRARPAETLKQAHRLSQQHGVHGLALTYDAHATARWLLPEPAMGVARNHLATVHQNKDPDTRSADHLLGQHRISRQRVI